MEFQQIRGATVKITYDRKVFLVDPFFAAKDEYSPLEGCHFPDKRWPTADLPMSIENIVAGIDAVIVTHMHHFDHFDDYAAKALPKAMQMFVQSEKENGDMKALGFTNVTTLTDEGVNFGDVALGLPSEACGVVFRADGEKTFYAAGDTLWYDGIRRAIEKHQPDVIALNAANAQMYDGTPILMGVDGVREVALAAPDAILIATHMDAVNHARVTREDLRKFSMANGLEHRLHIPEDGEIVSL